MVKDISGGADTTNNSQSESSYDWTVEEIEARLGSSTILFPRDRLLQAEDIAKMRGAGITRIEICASGSPGHLDIHNQGHITEIASQCEQEGVSIKSIHSPGFPYNSEDEHIRKKAVADGVVAAKVAEEMGARVMVCHFHTKEQSERSITEMLDKLEGHSIKLAIENGLDLADYTAFVDKIGSDRLGMAVDIGHTRDEDGVNPFIKKDRARETMAQCSDRLIHLHLHDWVESLGATLEGEFYGDHFAPLDGSIEWAEVFAALRDIDYKGVLMFEACWGEKRELSPDYVLGKVASFPQAFVDRYAGRPGPAGPFGKLEE